jgi:murein DD-endopeptidase MepM/ murein hydrolase activator NlpD
MPSRAVSCESHGILKLLAAVLLASASAACSSDSSRFGDNAFTNPFAASASGKVDRAATGSLANRSAPIQPVASQPLPPALPRAAGVANPLNPAQVATAPQAATARVASSTLQQAAPIGGSAAGWSATGGTPVTVGAGETASTLSARYGVPAAAILAANGGAIRSGQQAIIPIYNGAGAAKAAATTAATTTAAATATATTTASSGATSSVRSGTKAIEPTLIPEEEARPAPRPNAAAPSARPAASAPKPVAATPVAPKITPPKPVAATPAPAKAAATTESSRRIVAAAPKGPTPAQVAAKPAKPATPAKAVDDDEDEKPRKVVAQAQPATQPAAKPAAPQAKPAQPQSQAAQPARPQPRIIPLTPQKEKQEEAPARSAALMQADPTTTQSIPPAKPQPVAVAPAPAVAPAAPAEERADFRWPARGRVISGFGSKGGNGDGIAIAVPEGTPVKAASDGVVAYAGEELKGYGKLVLVRHENGYVSAYAHNGELNVKRGEKVSRGQTIAKSGATGNVTSPQLHFELRKGSTPVDPTKYLDN